MELQCILLLSVLSLTLSADMFASLQHLNLAIEAESGFYNTVEQYIDEQIDSLKDLKMFLKEKSRENDELTKGNPERLLSNPVNAYKTIKKMSRRVKETDERIDLFKQGYETVVSQYRSFLPDKEDVDGAIRALIRLQDTYDLSTDQLANSGLLVKNSSYEAPPLSAEDCYEIGTTAFAALDYYHSVLWLTTALEKFDSILPTSEYILSYVGATLNHLNYALFQQGNLERAMYTVTRWLNLEPDAHPGKDNRIYYQQQIDDQNKVYNPSKLPPLNNPRQRAGYHASDDFKRYELLCQGRELPENLKVGGKANPLNCYNKFSPVYLYAPMKAEQLHAKPDLWFFHHVMTEEEIKEVKRLATPKLHRSGVFNQGDATPEGGIKTETRVSKSAWVYDDESEIIASMSKKFARYADLNLQTAEALQVLNYGIGGHYEPHIDFARADNPGVFTEQQGNRIATFILYLSDVELGGATAFPKLGTAVWPEKGGAAFWFNLHHSGTGDERTLHGACPVLVGYKWVCNKWFHEGTNDVQRPCLLNDDTGHF